MTLDKGLSDRTGVSVGNVCGVRLPLRIGLPEKALDVLWRRTEDLREDLTREDVYCCNIVCECVSV